MTVGDFEAKELRKLLEKATTDNPWGGPYEMQDARNALVRAVPALLAEVERLKGELAGSKRLADALSAAQLDAATRADTAEAELLALRARLRNTLEQAPLVNDYGLPAYIIPASIADPLIDAPKEGGDA